MSQVPVEQLARLLLEQAQVDAGLPRRTAANSNLAPAGWVEPAPTPLHAPRRQFVAARKSDVSGELEALVSHVVTHAHEAEQIAREARATTQRVVRGVAVAVALSVFGVVTGITTGMGVVWHEQAETQARVALATMQALHQPSPLPPSADATTMSIGGPGGPGPAVTVDDVDHQPARDTLAPAIAPATVVRVLPAVAAEPQYPPPNDRPTQDASLAWSPSTPSVPIRPTSQHMAGHLFEGGSTHRVSHLFP